MLNARIEKLLKLLDSGSRVISEEAALNIAENSYQPQELQTLLDKLSVLLIGRNWVTRLSASKTLGYICNRKPTLLSITLETSKLPSDGSGSIFKFDDFCQELLNRLYFCLSDQLSESVLLASSSDDYLNEKMHSIASESSITSTNEILLAEMRSEIDRQVGLQSKLLGLSSREWLADDEILISDEMNRFAQSLPHPKRLKSADRTAISGSSFQLCFPDYTRETLSKEINSVLCDWIFAKFVSDLIAAYAFHPDWYVRHGAVIGLKACDFLILFLF